ncbi:hypothetical protein C6502_14940 [Candidatus Poribacteria bacterium]|nr:MAG: hypothetical protein C6502_14940 [Candidatus Poribacteria bacterium]
MDQRADGPMILTFHTSRFTHHVSWVILFILSLLVLGCGGGVKLINLPQSSAALNLSQEQQENIEPKIALIRDIIEDYEFERDEVEAEYRLYYTRANLAPMSRYEGGRGSRVRLEWHELRMKLRSFVAQRREYAREISGLIAEIKADLTPDQRVAFEDIELPELRLPEVLRRRFQDDYGMRMRGVPFEF